jgi:tetratricopeptide (TPR) repeat protein
MIRASEMIAGAIALALWAAAPLYAQPADPARMRPGPGIEALGTLPEPLDADDFLEAALTLSGGTPEEADRARSALAAALESAEGTRLDPSDPEARAEALLSVLHARILRRYVETQTRVDRAVLTGEYNCVSSAVLYAYLAKKAGLSVTGVRTPDHALCVVDLQGRPVDVETTNRYGFDPGSKKEFLDSFGRITGYAYVPPSRRDARRAIGDREFLGLILSNRIAELELKGRWDESVGLAFDYDALVGSPESRSFLLDRISNLTAGRHARNDWDGAFSALAEAAAALGPSPRLTELEALTAQAALSWFGSRRDWDGGLDYARRIPAAAVPDPRVQGLLRALAEGRLRDTVRTAPFAQAVPAVEEALASGILDARGRAELLEYLYGTEANAEAKRAGWLAGLAVLERGLARVPGSGALASARRVFRSNWTAEVHNRFAAHFNARRFEEAARALEEGLALDPGNPTLLRDLETLRAAR